MVPRVALIATIILVLLLTTWPVHPFVGHAHWHMVEWVPFSRVVSVRDLVANVALFMPLGLAVAWSARRARRATAVIVGLALSLFAEVYQVYCHDAFPTVTDLLANTLGAWLGAAWAVALARRNRIAPKPTKAPEAGRL